MVAAAFRDQHAGGRCLTTPTPPLICALALIRSVEDTAWALLPDCRNPPGPQVAAATGTTRRSRGRPRDGRGRAERPGRAAARRTCSAATAPSSPAMDSPVALIPQLARPSHRRRRQAPAPAADPGVGAAVRLSGRGRRAGGDAPRQLGRLRRVHPHRHPAARRRGGRKPAAPWPRQRQRGVRQQGLGAGRRLPVRALVPADDRGRLAGGEWRSCPRRPPPSPRARCCRVATQNDLSTSMERYLEVVHGKTAALFAAACRVGAVVAGRPERGRAGARRLRHQPRHGVPAGGRRARLRRRPAPARQDRGRRFPRGQDHPAGAGRLQTPGRSRTACSGAG